MSYRSVLFFCLLTALSGCSKSSEVAECTDNADCESGQACLDGACEDVGCLSSADCAIQSYCTEDLECASGCEQDVDCLAGQSCNTESNQCEAYGCRDTQLDCEYGEMCDETTGQCYVPDDPVCQDSCSYFVDDCGEGSCEVASIGASCDIDRGDAGCDAGEECLVVSYDPDIDCSDFWGLPDDSLCPSGTSCDTFEDVTGDGWPDNLCHSDACVAAYCMSACDSSEDCPRGFDCVESSEGGNICFADCGYLEESGYLP